ncbi:MAG: ribosomal protein S18-alanine N-acetyltransferase [Chloroflexi bacterium]|nr:ribosomal protein S18-alanine N-acetyltransferase [Chloroflexota bacterium]
MLPSDLPAVAEIEAASYSGGWPATAFAHELEHNRLARYAVLEARGVLAGFAGVWLMFDEAHVVTVAVAPRFRRQGLGKLLVHALVGLAKREGMAAATLECRVSNEAARRLYSTYGFYEVGARKAYYSDNGEDAVIMTTEGLETPAFAARYQRLEEQLAEAWPGSVACIGTFLATAYAPS